MTDQDNNNEERREGTLDLIEKILRERQEMLVLFCRVTGLNAIDDDVPSTDLVSSFCEILVDYSALVHFELYDRIISGQEKRNSVVKVAEEVYSRILEASEVAVEFSDRYDESDHQFTIERLHDDLSILGEEIAIRIELEDKLIAAILA